MRTGTAVVALVLSALAPAPDAEASPARLRLVLDGGAERSAVVGAAADDVQGLLRRAFPRWEVIRADGPAAVRILVSGCGPRGPGSEAAPASGPSPQGEGGYSWNSEREGGGIVLRLGAATEAGCANGLYGLLTERLGFAFHHPRGTLVPEHHGWPLPQRFRWSAAPRFASRGFHLHTQHPIELTEALLDPSLPGALDEVREYVDWLARNGQNVFQFFLLREGDRTRWPAHAAAFTAYAHGRGVRVGVAVSLAMLQQRAFRLAEPFALRSPARQARENLAWLLQVPWDFVTVEPTLGEHLPDLCGALPGLCAAVADELLARRRTPLFFTSHVIPAGDGERRRLPQGAGLLVHTVMCYALADEAAPVYGNRNLKRMAELARVERARRETWYWPESSYWVAFDSSVPVLLLPYLEARWADMNAVESLGLPGHLTFSSGWEWGYWLVDWSIARWSWRHETDGVTTPSGPLGPLRTLLPDNEAARLWSGALELQVEYLKRRALLPYLAAADPSAELFWPLDRPFQPRMPLRLARLAAGATSGEISRLLEGPVRDLEEFARLQLALVARLAGAWGPAGAGRDGAEVRDELLAALETTALRARHRALTLRAQVAGRRDAPGTEDADSLLARAALVRAAAQRLVSAQECRYRYPLARIARRFPGRTAYGFGYLWPASGLHFWRREEEQVRRRRFDAFFMNIWDFREITGIAGLWR